jgi:hypothetical protein
MTTRCETTDLPADQCAHCRQPPPEPPRRLGPWFLARYDGTCSEGCLIVASDRIRSDGEGGWLCEDCGNTP